MQKCNMKKSFIGLIAAVFMFAVSAIAQTNQDLRAVGGVVSDANSAPGWLSITLPAGSGLGNDTSLHFAGDVIRTNVTFIVGRSRKYSGKYIIIKNFPFNGNLFWKQPGTGEFVLRQTIAIRAFQLFHATTNYNAVGQIIVRPPQPIFDYGTPADSYYTKR